LRVINKGKPVSCETGFLFLCAKVGAVTATKRQLAQWAALKNRKDRDETGLFLAEGRKLAGEVEAAGWSVDALLALEGTAEAETGYALTDEQMTRVSGFRTAPEMIAVVRKPLSLEQPRWTPGTLALVLDDIQDPGNVGTLIRTAAWFGFAAVFHTAETADPFGPKAVQASMGALLRVKTGVVDSAWFETLPHDTPVIGTFLAGEPIFGAALPAGGLLVLGNEGHGIGGLAARVTRRVTVPRNAESAESLNVAAAAAIIMAEFRRGVSPS
jgi:TrmH family RNA methyltransferase